MAFWDYFRGPRITIIGIHSPIPYLEPGSKTQTMGPCHHPEKNEDRQPLVEAVQVAK